LRKFLNLILLKTKNLLEIFSAGFLFYIFFP